VLISPYPDQDGNKLQQQKILIFIYPIYNHNWRNISTIYIYNKTSIKRNILTIKKIHREVGQAKDLSALRYKQLFSKSLMYNLITQAIHKKLCDTYQHQANLYIYAEDNVSVPRPVKLKQSHYRPGYNPRLPGG
jgi:hypothetical protein